MQKFLERTGPFTHPDFEPNEEALSGFRHNHVVDMDIIDVSNLNRQFLFRSKDVGRPKADVAAEFINQRVPGCNVVPYKPWQMCFGLTVVGVVSLQLSLLSYEDGVLDPSSIIPLIDGGTEGFKGNARVILPGMTACIDCTLELYPPQITFPMCTIASMPRLPEQCIEYVRVLQWPKDKPFGDAVGLDGDNPEHVQWVFQESLKRAAEFNITGVTYRLTQGVVKRIIPAVASTNAVILSFKNYSFHRLLNCKRQMKSPAITATLEGINKTLYLQTIASIEERTRPNLCKTLKAVADVTTPQTVLFKLNFTSEAFSIKHVQS
uniref:NEDD8-activating enzyme E1 catalytic subunit n=1 Tax=Sinocyclocheilus rhinocerous TaxID=307959 RepID=A0A673HXU9_9TELE